MNYDYDMVWNGYTVCPKSWGMENVSEVFHRIYYVYGGEAYYICDGEAIPLEAGKLYIFPIMHPYTMWQNPDKPLDVLWFHVEMDIRLCTDVVNIAVQKESVLHHLLEAMRMMSNDVNAYSGLLKVFDVFLNLLKEQLQIETYPGSEMKKVLEYIEHNIGNDLSVESLAAQIGMERSYFSRKFKSIFSISPDQYIRAKKMKVAARELMEGRSVAKTAEIAGYNDEKAFSRAFKRYMEISPGRYRNIHIMQP